MCQATKLTGSQKEYLEWVEFTTKGRDLWIGPDQHCPDCFSTEGYDLENDEDYDEWIQEAQETSILSFRNCGGCSTSMGGSRFAAHYEEQGVLEHVDICVDCLIYQSNGELPRGWRQSRYDPDPID